MTLQLNGTSGLTFNDGSLQPSAASGKNLIINGDMMIDQRNAGASVTITSNAQYTLDRFQAQMSQASKYSVEQVGSSPAGFYYNLSAISSSAYTVLAADFFALEQRVEGFNGLNLDWGTSDAQTVTLSFWVKSSLTGTFTASLRNGATNRSFPFTYTIDSANTWEKKTITVAGDTTGTWAVTNTTWMRVNWSLGTGTNYTSGTDSGSSGAWQAGNYSGVNGAVNVVSTSGANFNITGVQLEANTTATPFENLQYGQQLALCQRYFQLWQHRWNGVAFASEDTTNNTSFITEMRAAPTVVRTGGVFDTRYPSSSWVLLGSTTNSVASRIRAGSAGGNDGWTANGTLEAEL